MSLPKGVVQSDGPIRQFESVPPGIFRRLGPCGFGFDPVIPPEMDVKLIEGEQAREWRNTTNHPEAYDYFLRGRAAHLEFTREGNALCRQLLEKAIELDPEFTKAIVQLGWNYGVEAETAWTVSSENSWEHALELANRAIALDGSFGEAHSLLGLIQINHVRDTERGIEELEKSVALNPNSSTASALLGTYAGLKGAPERAVETVKKAIRLNPFPPSWFFNALGSAHLLARQYDDSIAAFTQCIAQTPEFIPARVGLTIAYLETGKRDQALTQAGEVTRINPQFNPENYVLAQFDPSLRSRIKTLFANVP